MKAIRDASRQAKHAPDPVVWVDAGPNFDAANEALAALGQRRKKPMRIASKDNPGAYFPCVEAIKAAQELTA